MKQSKFTKRIFRYEINMLKGFFASAPLHLQAIRPKTMLYNTAFIGSKPIIKPGDLGCGLVLTSTLSLTHIRIFDEDGSGSVDFREFVMSLWNYCTLSKAALIMFAFDLYDNDNSGEIDLGEVELLLKEVYGREFQSSTQAQTIMAKIRGGDLGVERNINVDQFREFCRTHPAVLYPAFVLQTQMQVKILGSKFWLACSNARVKLSSGEYVNIAGILQAHVNEKVRKQKDRILAVVFVDRQFFRSAKHLPIEHGR